MGLAFTMCAACGLDEPETGVASSNLTGGNGVWQNGLSSNAAFENGVWQNGVWQNGVWQNGVWQNGTYANGVWQNGVWQNSVAENGVWQNGVWQNGVWQNSLVVNGVWQNGVWQNGVWQNGVWQNGVWQNNLRAKELLRDNPYTAQVLQYIYSCAMPQGASKLLDAGDGVTVQLDGGVGLWPTWAVEDSTCDADCQARTIQWRTDMPAELPIGTCDQTCQRWISACVLARTNAYGERVDISMRASDAAPPAIRRVLAVSAAEESEFGLREGAFFGNLFNTQPVTGGTVEPVTNAPAFFSCAGPGSNIPALTRRFCSSQGDNGPIKVLGTCEPSSAQPIGTCSQPDAKGAWASCNAPNDPRGNAMPYNEVITVYLRKPIVTCGNAVCEANEDIAGPESCPSDCHPGTWVNNYAFDVGWTFGVPWGSQKVVTGPENEIVIIGNHGSVDFGGGPIPGTGSRFAATFWPDGTYKTGARLGSFGEFNNGWGANIFVAADGSYATAGTSVSDPQGGYIARYSASGIPLPGWPVVLAGPGWYPTLQAWPVVDAAGNVIVAGTFNGTITIGATALTTASGDETFVAKFGPGGGPLWAVQYGGGYNAVFALAPDAAGNVLITSYAGIMKVSGVDGTRLWQRGGRFAGVVADTAGNVFVTGNDLTGYHDVFVQKLSGETGLPLAQATSTSVCKAGTPCSGRNDPGQISLDGRGHVIITAWGGSDMWEGIDFGFGLYRTYGTNDVFVAAYRTTDLKLDWVKHFPMVLDGAVSGMHVDHSGRVVVAGAYAGSALLDDRILISNRPVDGAVHNTFLMAFGQPDLNDHTPPTVDDVPGHIILEASSAAGALAWYMMPTAQDLGYSGATVECSPAPNTFLSIGDHPVNCYAFDPVGNRTGIHTFTITVRDSSGPSFTRIPEVVAQEGNTTGGRRMTYSTPFAIDQIDGLRSVTCSPASASVFPVGTTRVQCSAADNSGNTTSITFPVTVNDTTPPTITPPTAFGSAPGGVKTFTLAVSDLVDATPSVSCDHASGSVFPTGDTLVTCRATDDSNNASSTTFTVHRDVSAPPVDATPPVIAVPAPVAVEATGADGARVEYPIVTARDDVDGPVGVICSPASGLQFPIGQTPVLCTASDSQGNAASASFTVTVRDTTPPNLVVPGPLAAEATSGAGAVVTYDVAAGDTVGVASIACLPASGQVFALGATTVTCTATDAHDNRASATFTVDVRDTTMPSITVPATIVAEATAASGAAVPFAVTGNDLVSGPLAATCDAASGSTFAIGTITVHCTVLDGSRNATSGAFTVTVRDTTAPVVTVPANITVQATAPGSMAVTYSATATDTVDGSLSTACTPASGSMFSVGTTVVTCAATDTRGNTSSRTFNVVVRAPVLPWSGILQPINADGSSIFKLGSTVPVKFALTGTAAGTTTLVANLTLSKISNNASGAELEAASTSAADTGTAFRYADGQYIYNLATKNLSVGTWLLVIDFHDGVSRTVQISLKK